MYIECLAIIILILAMMVIFLRQNKKRTALAIFPLTFVPAAHALFYVLQTPISQLAKTNTVNIHMFLDILALVIAGIFFGEIAGKLKSRAGRASYLIICSGFTLVLTFVLVLNILA